MGIDVQGYFDRKDGDRWVSMAEEYDSSMRPMRTGA